MTLTMRGTLAALTFTAGTLLSGCAEKAATEAEVPEISSLQAAQSEVSVAKGSSKQVLFVIGRRQDFNGVVTLTVENVPAGVTASFGPGSLGSTAVNSILTVTATPSAQAGTYTLRARASSPQVDSRTIDINVAITTPEIGLTLGSAASTVTQGAQSTVTVNVERTGGYTGSVALTVSGLPAGVTGTFAPSILQDGATTSTLTLTAALLAEPGVKEVTIRAAGTGVDVRTLPLALTVGLAPNPALILTPGGATVLRGVTTDVNIPIGRSGGYAGAVSMTLEGTLPAGVTAEFLPSTTLDNVVVLRFTSTPATPGGFTTLQLRARGDGVADATAQFILTVMLPPGFILTLNPSALTIAQKATVNVGLSIVRQGGYSDATALSVQGVPAGLTFNVPAIFPAGTTNGAMSLPMTASEDLAPGVYPITITGVGAGGLTSATTITVTVVP